jgi:hypothetical protein
MLDNLAVVHPVAWLVERMATLSVVICGTITVSLFASASVEGCVLAISRI